MMLIFMSFPLARHIITRPGCRFSRPTRPSGPSYVIIESTRGLRTMATVNYSTEYLSDRYHKAIVDWQKKHFPELDLLLARWNDYFPRQTPYHLMAKVGPLRSEQIEVGELAGQQRFN